MAVPAAIETDNINTPLSLPPLPVGAFAVFVKDPATRSRVEAELPLALTERAPIHVVAGGLAAAMHVTGWPAGLSGLILDIDDSSSPVADMAALIGSLSGDCVVIAIGQANDVGLFRDLSGTGVADYLIRPLTEGLLHKALEKALIAKSREIELRSARAALKAAAASDPSARRSGTEVEPLVVACCGTRGGVGVTTLAIALASMLGQARNREALILDLDMHCGSVMLALDLDATEALREALSVPARVDNLFVDQSVQRKSDLLYALGAEEALQTIAPPELGAILRIVSAYKGRFRQIVLDLPRGDPLIQRQALEAATDFVLVCDLTLAGTRDAMRLLNFAADAAPHLRIHLVASGATDPRRASIKLADLERSVKHKAVCQIAFDDKSVAAAINAGKPLNEAMPRSAMVKSLRPLVEVIRATVDHGDPAVGRGRPFWSKLLRSKSRIPTSTAGVGA
ncbi:cellulose synthase operon protein YhjQ/BcsQ [Reyranella sp. CPCC 100927]|uniref:AAA family ATPase n=1 Tax=Reyranella sp. CPCC 100927 TaxID=2599616 RepID=UPI0011B55602|nr:cellulose synthase operon protein YhjQ/BcsQ [Reyranella sp. CPCC 100927]TWT10216.1 AAA family ATPase [Reyranella sp. CPCC 100927]